MVVVALLGSLSAAAATAAVPPVSASASPRVPLAGAGAGAGAAAATAAAFAAAPPSAISPPAMQSSELIDMYCSASVAATFAWYSYCMNVTAERGGGNETDANGREGKTRKARHLPQMMMEHGNKGVARNKQHSTAQNSL